MRTFLIWCLSDRTKQSKYRQEINIDKPSLAPRSSYLQVWLSVHVFLGSDCKLIKNIVSIAENLQVGERKEKTRYMPIFLYEQYMKNNCLVTLDILLVWYKDMFVLFSFFKKIENMHRFLLFMLIELDEVSLSLDLLIVK